MSFSKLVINSEGVVDLQARIFLDDITAHMQVLYDLQPVDFSNIESNSTKAYVLASATISLFSFGPYLFLRLLPRCVFWALAPINFRGQLAPKAYLFFFPVYFRPWPQISSEVCVKSARHGRIKFSVGTLAATPFGETLGFGWPFAFGLRHLSYQLFAAIGSSSPL